MNYSDSKSRSDLSTKIAVLHSIPLGSPSKPQDWVHVDLALDWVCLDRWVTRVVNPSTAVKLDSN
jgi:hypothetical protein